LNIVGHKAIEVKETIFAPEALRRLREYELLRRRQPEEIPVAPNDTYYDYDTGNTLFTQEFVAPSTTMISGNPEDSQFNKVLQDQFESNFLKG
jgi:hypothetical protein